MNTENGMSLKHKATGLIVVIVPHQEAIDQGFALGMGEDVYSKGITIKFWNKLGNTVAYNFILFENLDKDFERID